MSAQSQINPASKQWADAVRSPFLWVGWMVSLLVHTGLLIFIMSTLSKWDGGGTPQGSEEFREVGLVVENETAEDQQQEESSADEAVESSSEAPFTADSDIDSPQLNVEDAPPVDLATPQVSQPKIGPGALSQTSPSSSDVRDMVKPSGTQPTRSSLGVGLGQASFFGVTDSGSRVVYLLDRSGSMSSYNAIRVAKAELLSSLETLDRTQQFQVMFYNTRTVLLAQDSSNLKLYWATDVNQTLARQFINGVQPDGGTEHVPALKRALRFEPEILFFLTDADEPQLSAGELAQIKQLNNGRAKIHCIEFGKGPELSADNFLKKLARQNGGSYRYRDVTRFGER